MLRPGQTDHSASTTAGCVRSLLRYLSWSHWKRHPLRAALAIFSIALGVALFVSTEVAHASTIRAFSESQARLRGRARWTVDCPGGLTPDRLETLDGDPRFDAAPVVEGSVALPDDPDVGRLMVRGIDLVRERRLRSVRGLGAAALPRGASTRGLRACVLPRRLGRMLGLDLGASLRMSTAAGVVEVPVVAWIDDVGPAAVLGGRIAFMDASAAAQLLGRAGRFDRIDVAPANSSASMQALGALLLPGETVRPAELSNRTLDDMLANIRSLVILSVIGLLVGLFIVYLSVSIGVVERSRAIATTRALGATPRQILGTFLIEAVVLGGIGAVLGIALGTALAHAMLQLIADTVNRFVLLVEVERVVLPHHAWVLGLLAGTGTAVLAAGLPARRAAAVEPAMALRPALLGSALLPNYRHAFWGGIGVLALGLGVTFFLQLRAHPTVGLIAMALLFIGIALMLPQITIWMSGALRKPLRRHVRVEAFLAADNVMRYPQRSALTVVALGGALALMVTASSIVAGFHDVTNRWLDYALPFDLSVQPARLSTTIYSGATLPLAWEDKVAAVSGVREAYGVRARVVRIEDLDVLLLGVDIAAYRRVLREQGMDLRGSGDAGAHERLMGGDSCAVSENLARGLGLARGDWVTIPSPTGPVRLPITHITEDYSWPRGSIALDRRTYQARWQDDTLTYLDVDVAADTPRGVVRSRIEEALGGAGTSFIYENEDIRRYATDALEQSFRLVDAQIVVAMVIGFLGILNTLLLSVLRRTRELGLLRVVGMTPQRIGRTVSAEGVMLALLGAAFGIASGLFAAAFPAANHVLLATGYRIPFVVPWGTIALVFGAALAIGGIASLLPARRAAAVPVLTAIGYE